MQAAISRRALTLVWTTQTGASALRLIGKLLRPRSLANRSCFNCRLRRVSADHGGYSSPARVGVGASGGFEAELARTLAQREARIVEREAQVAELTIELQRRKKGFRPKANAISRPKRDKDGQAKGERKHPGVVRPPVALRGCPKSDVALSICHRYV